MNRVPLLLLLIGSFALTANSDSLYHKRYINCDHGYSVKIPLGVVAHGEDPPKPNHGFGVDMRNRATLNDVSYQTSPDWLYLGAGSKVHDLPEEAVDSPEDEIDYRFDDLQKVDGRPEARIISRSTVSLGGLRAVASSHLLQRTSRRLDDCFSGRGSLRDHIDD